MLPKPVIVAIHCGTASQDVEHLVIHQSPRTRNTGGIRIVHQSDEKFADWLENNEMKKIDGSTVHFVNGTSADFDKIVYCTGYKVNLPFLSDSILSNIFSEETNELRMYKNVFAPKIGPSLAFIGFVQPASGGVLTMSEMQARWFSALCKGQAKLPSKADMELDIKKDLQECKDRYYKSGRHTIQKDPIVYADEIASLIGAKPDIFSHPKLAWRLIFSSCGPAQWRLKGPHQWSGATKAVMNTPLPDFSNYLAYFFGVVFLAALYYLYRWTFGLFGL